MLEEMLMVQYQGQSQNIIPFSLSKPQSAICSHLLVCIGFGTLYRLKSRECNNLETLRILFGTQYDGQYFLPSERNLPHIKLQFNLIIIPCFSVKTDVMTDYILERSNTSLQYDCYPSGNVFKMIPSLLILVFYGQYRFETQ